MILDVDLEKERISLGLKQTHAQPVGRHRAQVSRSAPASAARSSTWCPTARSSSSRRASRAWCTSPKCPGPSASPRASDVLNVGQEVDAVVLSINKDEQKISLGIRQTEANPWDTVQEKYPIGTRVKGKVRNFTTYGAFVELEEGIDGMIHVSDMSWTRKINHPSEVLKKGDEVEAVVLEVDAAQPAHQPRPQAGPGGSVDAASPRRYQVGQTGQGQGHQAGLLRRLRRDRGRHRRPGAHQPDQRRPRAEGRDVLKLGQEVEARVIKIDPVERRIGLSIKAAKLSDEEFEVDDEMLEGLRPGEDLVDLAGAFDEAFGAEEEWHPGEKRD